MIVDSVVSYWRDSSDSGLSQSVVSYWTDISDSPVSQW